MKKPVPQIMTPSHPKWKEFLERLEGPEGCDFREKIPGDSKSIAWNCRGGKDRSRARAILSRMDFDELEVERSMSYFSEHGGYCDCEILFNVG